MGPEGEDWRVPVSELESRQTAVRAALATAGIESLLVQHPVDLHWLCGGRQQGVFWIPAADLATPDGSPAAPIQWVRRSLARAAHEAGGDDAPHAVAAHPRSATWGAEIAARGATLLPALQLGAVPHAHAETTWRLLARSHDGPRPDAPNHDGTGILHGLRETKSAWELDRHRESGALVHLMFEAIAEQASEGDTELELAALAESIGREAGFGGFVPTRRYPMACDRAVIVSGRAGGIPSFFDAAVGGTGGHPGWGMGAGHRRLSPGEPILVDIVHLHRGYVADETRMFSVGAPDPVWEERLSDMVEVREQVTDALAKGETCTEAWELGSALAEEQGWAQHLMGMPPDQTRFLAHSVGLELDESPVVARGFQRPMPVGGVMAVEPKLVFPDGSVGAEDCFIRTQDGLECMTSGADFPWWTEL